MSAPRWNLLQFGGTISPSRYFTIGFGLTVLKQVLDQLVATRVFGRPWSPLSYALTGVIGGLFSLGRDDQIFYAYMLALALPFLVVGVILTVRRLRDAGWPLWLAAFFFAPMPINIVFFCVLCLVPTSSVGAGGTLADVTDVPLAEKSKSDDFRPGFSYSRAVPAILLPLPLALVLVYLGTYVLRDYGWSLFLGLPFVLPMLSVIIYGYRRDATQRECLQLGWLWVLFAILGMVATALEGVICIIMLLPLFVPIVLLGVMVGYFIVEHGFGKPRDLAKYVIVLAALMPTMLGAEHLVKPEPLRFICETSTVINAPPERVWRHVVSFSDLDPPSDWVFRTGVAYPVRARIEGTGVGAVRRCEFSTGAFVEPIEVWDEPRLLRFGVTSNPAPMREWNPLFEIHPPHLDGFLVAKQGQFLLTALPDGKTLLAGSTLYQHGLWPASYWRLWSDPIIHRIHDRVLRHIKTLAESPEA
jgi:uncharacterized membrane protein YhaH (DUF805 family)